MLKNLLEKRNTAIAAARTIVEKADKEVRSMTAEERQNYDKAWAEQLDIKGDIDRAEKLEAEERDLATSRGRQTSASDVGESRGNKPAVLEYRGQKMENLPRFAERSSEHYRKAFRSYLTAEQRAAASFANDVDADGGYLHAPYQFFGELIQSVDNAVNVRKYARVIPVTSTDSLGVPTLTSQLNDADWTTEVGTISPDQSMQFGLRQLVPNQLTKEVDISLKLLSTAAMSPESIVADRGAAVIAKTQEKAFLTGDGSGKPLGLYTASASGIDTSRDVSTGNTSTAITFDGLQATKYSLKAQYRSGSRWSFHRDGISQIAKIKDTTGQYIWQPSKKDGEPDTILGLPVDESEYVPNTFTTGLYVGGLFNYKYYWIAELMGVSVQRLNELLARSGKVGFIFRTYLDAQPVLAEAFARVKLA